MLKKFTLKLNENISQTYSEYHSPGAHPEIFYGGRRKEEGKLVRLDGGGATSPRGEG
jgi:hypothetical protein